MRLASVVASLLLGGCALGPGLFGEAADDSRPTFRDSSMSVPQAASLLEPARSRKDEVAARLGPAETVRFDSGYEVWVYRSHGREATAKPELVLLFDPQGVLSKSRVRPGTPAPR